MSAGDLFAAPHVERGDGFAMQATTHWLRLVPGRTLFGLKAGGLPVTLPDLPDGVRHRGIEASTDGHRLALIDVSSHWLRDHAAVLDQYTASLRAVLADRKARVDAYTTHVAVHGSVEVFLGRELDRVPFDLAADDGSYHVAMDLLKHAPREGRVPFAMPASAGAASFETPDFLLGNQAWIDGGRLLVEFNPEEGGRVETVALERDAFEVALERCWGVMGEVSGRIETAVRAYKS